jgi:hypothetical protein
LDKKGLKNCRRDLEVPFSRRSTYRTSIREAGITVVSTCKQDL